MVTEGPEAVFQAAKQPIPSASASSAGGTLAEDRYEWRDVPGEEFDGPGASALCESANLRLAVLHQWPRQGEKHGGAVVAGPGMSVIPSHEGDRGLPVPRRSSAQLEAPA